jgi:hypothetical protein
MTLHSKCTKILTFENFAGGVLLWLLHMRRLDTSPALQSCAAWHQALAKHCPW